MMNFTSFMGDCEVKNRKMLLENWKISAGQRHVLHLHSPFQEMKRNYYSKRITNVWLCYPIARQWFSNVYANPPFIARSRPGLCEVSPVGRPKGWQLRGHHAQAPLTQRDIIYCNWKLLRTAGSPGTGLWLVSRDQRNRKNSLREE